ncbi:WXG100 family type VII secretion target [Dactylosporangium sp. NPDC050688]|uniref:WXG100 family type VII secretion target n=1 Tax=Dactylosporangium sp. NPDC050688 TaxID=3157217 RepID=UPI0033DCA1EF
MADYSVNPNGLLDTADELQIIQNQLRSSLDALGTAVQNFQNSNHGESIVGFSAAQAKWDGAMVRMQGALDTARTQLIQIQGSYKLADNRSAAMFNGMV